MTQAAKAPAYEHAFPARYWHVLDDGRFQCDVCPRACRLRDGQRGLCFVRARDGGSTFCHHCGHLLIERDWYRLGAWNLTDAGRCGRCGTPCAGVFDGPPGTWGRRRQPVDLQRQRDSRPPSPVPGATIGRLADGFAARSR